MTQISICLEPNGDRTQYLSKLVNRLSNTVQLFQPNKRDTARNRLEHSQNMARISMKISGANGYPLTSDLTMGCMLHDIGHHALGHDAERLLQRVFPKVNYCNTQQSRRFCYDEDLNSSLPLFQTKPESIPVSLSEKGVSGVSTLDFIDQLENCFGDTLDIFYSLDQPFAIKMLHKLGVDYLDDLPKPKDSYQLCIDYLNRRGLLGMDFEEIISLICPIVFEVNQDISEFVGNSAYFSTAGSNNEMEVSRGLTKITENHLFKNLTDQEIVDVAVSITGVNQNDI